MLPAFLASIWARLYELDLNHNTIVEDNAELEIINNKLEKQVSELLAAATINIIKKTYDNIFTNKGGQKTWAYIHVDLNNETIRTEYSFSYYCPKYVISYESSCTKYKGDRPPFVP